MAEDHSWKGKSVASPIGILIFIKIIRHTGLIPSYFFLFFVALYYTLFLRSYRKYIELYRQKFNKKTNLIHIFKHSFFFGANMIDRFAHLVMKKTPFSFTCIGEDNLKVALKKKKGLILLSSHIGNQEIAGDVLFDHLDTKVNYLMRDDEKESIKKITSKVTQNRNVRVIPTNLDDLEMMLKVKMALSNNEIVCMLGDRVMGDESFQKIEFLGKNAKFPTGPFKIAAITGSPVITAVTIKTGFRHYTQKVFDYFPFDEVNRKNRDKMVRSAMEKYVSDLEKIIRQYHYHWFNFYDYWDELEK